MQICNGCNAVNIEGNPIKDMNAKLTYLSSGSEVEKWLTLPIWLTRMSPKILQFRFSLDMVERWLTFPSWLWNLVEILVILLLHVLSNDACKCAIKLFLISWEPFENVNLLYFLFWMQIWNGCNALNIAGNPIKDISAKFTFLSSGSKVERWLTAPGCEICWKSWKF